MTNVFERMHSMLSDTGVRVYEKVLEHLPQAALAVLLIGIGLLSAAALFFLTRRVLDFFAVDKLAGKTPIDRIMKSVGIRKSISEIIALLVFWVTVLFFIIWASDVLHLEQLSSALEVILGYLPQIIFALLTVIFGMLLAKFLQTVVQSTMERVDDHYAKTVGKIVYTLVAILVIMLVFEQLGFDLSLITTNMMIFVCVLFVIVTVGMMIASRTLMENILATYQLRQIIHEGDEVNIDHVQGTVKKFTLGGVMLQVGENETVVPAIHFFKHTYSLTHRHPHGE